MSDRGDVVEWVETTEDVIIIQECLLPNGDHPSAPTGTPMEKLLDTMVHGEDADFDDGFYCEECRSLFQEQSSVCISGPSFILDSPTNMAVPERALLTLPHGLMIGRSSIPNTGLGVMNQGPAVTPGMHFGPYEGEATTRDDAVASRFSWEASMTIYKVNEDYDYIDAARETHSNWMRYVNCARNQEETNLLAVQYKGSILFHCCRTIHPGDELVVWPSGGLLSRLSEAWSHIWLMKLPPIESDLGITSHIYLCADCPLSFTTETYRQRHVEHFHAQPKMECATPSAEAAEPQNQNHAAGEDAANPVESSLVFDAFEAKTCSECGKIFKHTHHLKRHMLSVHSNKRPYCCPQCRRSFSQTSGLLRHQLVHKKQALSDEPADQNQSGGQETEMETGGSVQTPSLPDSGGGEAAVNDQEPTGTEEATVGEHTPVMESRPPEEAKGTTAPGKKLSRCLQCDKSFSSGYYLEKHKKRVHSDLRPYVCTLCRKTFIQHNDLTRHLKSHQKKDKSEKSDAPLTEEDAESSDRSTDDSQEEDMEDLDFIVEPAASAVPEPPKEPSYQRPQRLGVRSRIAAITKLIAPKRRTAAVNKRKTQSPAGITAESKDEPDSGAPSAEEGKAKTAADGSGLSSCAHCKQQYESHEALKEHACATAPHKCAHCDAAFKKAGFLKRHERTAHADAKSYACDVCGKAFVKLFNLKQHQKIKSCDRHHCTSEIFSCTYCPFSFTIHSYLRKHVRRHHSAEYLSLSEAERLMGEPFGNDQERDEGDLTSVCPRCGKTFATARKRAAHRCAQQAVLYLCTDCGKGFSNHYGLKQHQRVHTGVRPHGCPHCHKTFVHTGQLNVHLRTHTGERPYLCTHCGESFRQSGDLKRHERKHTGVRPHGCPECFKSFSRPQSLRAHQMLHLGQRLFKCGECGKSFSRNYHLRRHQQKMHS
ncbi:hypothetical protein NHX12_025261 [Muraenolepis orangiensis]|uniref:Histone-lysine N-methyltransferase PRDM9 n=1 Tax=Muraenolepis orangiensis TaxID=630683 RepID=A0A9Q0EJV9_9TELE|nr:hypothetical protein NHX12_025261 [Muraenolepis orangiensis]